MDFGLELLQKFANACIQTFAQPFYYIGILFVILHYRRQILLERKLFHSRLHSLLEETGRTLIRGLVAGILVSVLMAFIGVSLSLEAIIGVWAASAAMMLFRARFLCLAYGVGVLGIAQFAFGWFPQLQEISRLGTVFAAIDRIDIPALLALVGVLHLAEALLIRRYGSKMSSPLFFAGKRGKLIGGYQLQGFWPMPLFLLIPAETSGTMLPWQPLFGGDWSGGWTMMAFPVLIGFAELTMSRLPQQKALWSSNWLLLYSGIVLLLAVGAHFLPALTVVAALVGIALHELLVWYSTWDEGQQRPLYVHDERGLHVLAVLPKSPAAELGILPGEIIHKVNGTAVHTKEELHVALRLNPAFCKLEVINLDGQSKFMHRALYSGDHHQLGVILSPDQDAGYYVEMKHSSIFAYARAKLTGYSRNNSASM